MMLLDIGSVLTNLSISYHVNILATNGKGCGRCNRSRRSKVPTRPAVGSCMLSGLFGDGLGYLFIHMLGCNRPRWHGTKLVSYTFLEIVNGDCMDGWSRSRHSKVPKQLAVDGSKLSERCKAGATGPKSCTNMRV